MHVIAWILSVGACVASLIFSQRYRAGLVVVLATSAIIGGMLLVTVIGLALREFGMRPSDEFLAVLVKLLLALCIIGMLTIMNVASRAMVDGQGAFHRRYNASNLRRFPVSVAVSQAAQIKKFATCFWAIGAGNMFYGVWFAMKL